MGFLAPGFLLGALAVGLPLYLHLLRRHTGNPQPFSSIMLFEPQQRSQIRRRRLRYWLLLALRLAVLLLLVLAFADPYFHRLAALAPAEKLWLLVVDDSFSMRAGTRLAQAKQAALEVLDAKPRADRAVVLALGAQARALTAATSDASALRAAVRSIEAGDSRGSYAALAGAARSIAQSEHTPIELHLFSDMQRTGMPPSFAEMALPPNVTLTPHPVAAATEPNWTIESVAAPTRVWSPRELHVLAVIAGYGTPAATRSVSFLVNGTTVATQSVMVPASGRATVRIDSLDVPYGLNRCAVRIDAADALSADDEYLFAVERADPTRGLFIHQESDSRSPLYFGTALESALGRTIRLDVVSVDQAADLDPGAYGFVVLSDIAATPDALRDKLLQYARRGGGVLIALGTASAQERNIPVLGGSMGASHYYSREPERYASMGATDPAHAAVGAADQWSGVKFFYAATVAGEGARVLARLTDQTPVLMERPEGEGRVMVFASGFDNVSNDLPLHPVFVAFVDRAVRYLSGNSGPGGARVVDDLLELRTPDERAVGVELIDPRGRRPLSLEQSASAETFALARAGFYELRLANGRHDLVAVNPSRRESDLSAMPQETLALWRGGNARAPAGAPLPAAAAAAVPQGAMRSRLWWYAVCSALVAALAESLVASGYLGTRREQT